MLAGGVVLGLLLAVAVEDRPGRPPESIGWRDRLLTRRARRPGASSGWSGDAPFGAYGRARRPGPRVVGRRPWRPPCCGSASALHRLRRIGVASAGGVSWKLAVDRRSGNPLVLAAQGGTRPDRRRPRRRPGRERARRRGARTSGTTRIRSGALLGYLSPRFGASGLERSYGPRSSASVTAASAVGCCASSGAIRTTNRTCCPVARPALQRRAMRLLRGERGAMVAIEPATGRILAMASTPTGPT